MKLIIKPLPGNDRGPRHMEAVLRAIHAASVGHRVCLSYTGTAQGVVFSIEFPAEMRSTILEHLQDAFPDCIVSVVREADDDRQFSWSQSVTISPDVFSLRPYSDFESTFENVTVDPATGLLSSVRPASTSKVVTTLAVEFTPGTRRRVAEAERILTIARLGFPSVSICRLYLAWRTSGSRWKRLLAMMAGRVLAGRGGAVGPSDDDGKLHQSLFECTITVCVHGADRSDARKQLQRMVGAFGPFVTSQTKVITGSPATKPRRLKRPALLSASDIALLMHPTVATAGVAKLSTEAFRELEPPTYLPSKENDHDATQIGRVRFRGQTRRFGIHEDDLRRHLFLCGRTGTGKTTLIRSMALDAIQSGRNVVVIDPHGDLAESIADCIPRNRTNDVLYFNAADRHYPVSFNPLDCQDALQHPLVADGLVLALKKLYGDSWGPRLEQILRNSILALLGRKDATLLAVRQMLTSKTYRSGVVAAVEDPVVRSFWIDTFDKWNDRFQTEAVSPVLNKLDAFLANSIARNITCQPSSTVNLRTILDNPSSIMLCNLSKGLIGEQTSNLLGAFLVASLQTAALSRADMPENERTDVQVYIDEFHSFVSDGNNSFATILSESRKYRVSFAALATQFLDQIDEATLSAVLGNCGSSIVFRSGIRDAEVLASHLGGIRPDEIVNLPNFTAYAKLLINGEPCKRPFSMTTSPPQARSRERARIVCDVSRKKYGRPAARVNPEHVS